MQIRAFEPGLQDSVYARLVIDEHSISSGHHRGKGGYLREATPSTMNDLNGFCTRGRDVIRANPDQGTVLLVQLGVFEGHSLLVDDMPFPQARDTGQKRPGDFI